MCIVLCNASNKRTGSRPQAPGLQTLLSYRLEAIGSSLGLANKPWVGSSRERFARRRPAPNTVSCCPLGSVSGIPRAPGGPVSSHTFTSQNSGPSLSIITSSLECGLTIRRKIPWVVGSRHHGCITCMAGCMCRSSAEHRLKIERLGAQTQTMARCLPGATRYGALSCVCVV